MASEKQFAANRQNGKLGGPKTPAGKDKVKDNAFKHGLSGRNVIAPWEKPKLFETYREAICAEFQPQGWEEESLVDTIAYCSVQRQRAVKIEVSNLRGDKGGGNVNFTNPDLWQTLFGYRNNYTKTETTAIDRLKKLRKDRPAQVVPPMSKTYVSFSSLTGHMGCAARMEFLHRPANPPCYSLIVRNA